MDRRSHPTTRHPTTRERRDSERSVWRIGLALSVLLHVLAFVLWPSGDIEVSPYAAAGPRSGDPAAAGGSMQAVNVPSSSPEPIVPPQVPTPTMQPVEEVQFDEPAATDPSEILGQRPGTEGPGLEDGTGRGDAGTADEGMYRRIPPSPRGMIVPPSNEDLEGQRIEVWVFVNENGEVVKDSTRLDPPTGDDDFDERLIEEASEWVFEPAREGGEAVAAWFPYTISM